MKLANAQATDLMDVVGQRSKVPVTGTANINAHVSGTIENMNGGGNVTLTNGVAYGEGYQTIAVDATVLGQQINASRVLVAAHGMQVTGNGGYNVASKRILAHIEGKNIQLSKLDVVRRQNVDGDASVTSERGCGRHGGGAEPACQGEPGESRRGQASRWAS